MYIELNLVMISKNNPDIFLPELKKYIKKYNISIDSSEKHEDEYFVIFSGWILELENAISLTNYIQKKYPKTKVLFEVLYDNWIFSNDKTKIYFDHDFEMYIEVEGKSVGSRWFNINEKEEIYNFIQKSLLESHLWEESTFHELFNCHRREFAYKLKNYLEHYYKYCNDLYISIIPVEYI